jgi:hypothetical protein
MRHPLARLADFRFAGAVTTFLTDSTNPIERTFDLQCERLISGKFVETVAAQDPVNIYAVGTTAIQAGCG